MKLVQKVCVLLMGVFTLVCFVALQQNVTYYSKSALFPKSVTMALLLGLSNRKGLSAEPFFRNSNMRTDEEADVELHGDEKGDLTKNLFPRNDVANRSLSQSNYMEVSTLSGDDAYDQLGRRIAMSDNGLHLVVGSSSFKQQTNGMVRVLSRSNRNDPFVPVGSDINGENEQGFGSAVAMSSDGLTIAIGAYHTQVDSREKTGAVYIYWRAFTKDEFEESKRHMLPGTKVNEMFGENLFMTPNGLNLAVFSRTQGNDDKGQIKIYRRDSINKGFISVSGILVGTQSLELLGLQSISMSEDGLMLSVCSPTMDTVHVFKRNEVRDPFDFSMDPVTNSNYIAIQGNSDPQQDLSIPNGANVATLSRDGKLLVTRYDGDNTGLVRTFEKTIDSNTSRAIFVPHVGKDGLSKDHIVSMVKNQDYDMFIGPIRISSDKKVMIVAGRSVSTDLGRAYLFQRYSNHFVFDPPSDGNEYIEGYSSLYGMDIAISSSGETIIVADATEDVNNTARSGAIHVYTTDNASAVTATTTSAFSTNDADESQMQSEIVLQSETDVTLTAATSTPTELRDESTEFTETMTSAALSQDRDGFITSNIIDDEVDFSWFIEKPNNKSIKDTVDFLDDIFKITLPYWTTVHPNHRLTLFEAGCRKRIPFDNNNLLNNNPATYETSMTTSMDRQQLDYSFELAQSQLSTSKLLLFDSESSQEVVKFCVRLELLADDESNKEKDTFVMTFLDREISLKFDTSPSIGNVQLTSLPATGNSEVSLYKTDEDASLRVIHVCHCTADYVCYENTSITNPVSSHGLPLFICLSLPAATNIDTELDSVERLTISYKPINKKSNSTVDEKFELKAIQKGLYNSITKMIYQSDEGMIVIQTHLVSQFFRLGHGIYNNIMVDGEVKLKSSSSNGASMNDAFGDDTSARRDPRRLRDREGIQHGANSFHLKIRVARVGQDVHDEQCYTDSSVKSTSHGTTIRRRKHLSLVFFAAVMSYCIHFHI